MDLFLVEVVQDFDCFKSVLYFCPNTGLKIPSAALGDFVLPGSYVGYMQAIYSKRDTTAPDSAIPMWILPAF